MSKFDRFLHSRNGKLALGTPIFLIVIAVGVGMGGSGGLTGASGFAFSEPTQTPTVAAPVEEIKSAVPLEIPTSAPTATLEPPTPTPLPSIGSVMVSEVDGANLVFVPQGDFLMGSSDSDTTAHDDEKPQHTVTLDAFWIDQFEVTNSMYAKCVNAGACAAPSDTTLYSDAAYSNYAVVFVSWYDAGAYCAWAGKRLPTEAEWEKAARGTDGRLFPWGNDLPTGDLLNFRSEFGAVGVGAYPGGASPYGAYDMAGNVWEWTSDSYNETYYRTSPSVNPLGPEGQDKVLRGGAWYSVTDSVRTAYRSWVHPTTKSHYFGFRCVRNELP
jgi:serine/threonine-protein kinase